MAAGMILLRIDNVFCETVKIPSRWLLEKPQPEEGHYRKYVVKYIRLN